MTTLVDCPQSNLGQWNFRLFGTPVRVKFWFWVTLLILASDRELPGVLIWAGVCFVSILLHEMGHVLAFRLYRRDAEVVLYGFGGLAIPRRDVVGVVPEVVVAAAGPLAGFCLAGLVTAVVLLTGGHTFVTKYMFLPDVTALVSYRLLLWTHSVSLYRHATMLVNDMLFVNLFWGMVNLMPVWPLDGGHIARALLERWDPVDGRRKSLVASAVIGGAVALAGVANRNTWLAVMFGIFAVSSLQALEGEKRRGIPTYRRWRD